MGKIIKYIGWEMFKKAITSPRYVLMGLGAMSILSFFVIGC